MKIIAALLAVSVCVFAQFCKPASAAITLVNTTTCSVADGAGPSLTCPLIATPAPGNVLLGVIAGAGGTCNAIMIGATIIDSSGNACYEVVYYIVGPEPPTFATLLNLGGMNAVVAVILEVSGVDTTARSRYLDAHTMYASMRPCAMSAPLPANTCASSGIMPALANSQPLVYAVTHSVVSVSQFATFPATTGGFASAIANGTTPVRVDVGYGSSAGLNTLFGAFQYSGAASAAMGLVLIEAS